MSTMEKQLKGTKRIGQITQSQKLMVFVLSMVTYGLSMMLTELLPSIWIGPVRIYVQSLRFIPLSLAMLFDPFSAAIGGAIGELVFSEVMLGQFGGLHEFAKVITTTIGVYVAGRMVKNPRNKKSVGFAALTGTGIYLFLAGLISVGRVVIAGRTSFGSSGNTMIAAGIPESIFAIEAFGFLNSMVLMGIVFSMIPAMALVPKLYGKIEPLMGMRPRDEETFKAEGMVISPKFVLIATLGFSVAGYLQFARDMEAAEALTFLAISAGVSLVLSLIAFAMNKKSNA